MKYQILSKEKRVDIEKSLGYVSKQVTLEKIVRAYNENESVYFLATSNVLNSEDIDEYEDIEKYNIFMMKKGEMMFDTDNMKWMKTNEEDFLENGEFVDSTEFEKEVYKHFNGRRLIL